MIWTSFPVEPEESEVLKVILEPGSSRGLISMLYGGLKRDRMTSTLGMLEMWNGKLDHPLTEGEWKRACAQVKLTSSNARFKLTQFYYLHQAYRMPQRLSRIYEDRAD